MALASVAKRTVHRLNAPLAARRRALAARALGRVNDRRWATTIPHEQVGALLFGQQHVTTADYFAERVGASHTVPLATFPHALAAAGQEAEYLEYLEQSWRYYGLPNTEETRRARLERFREHKRLIADGRLPVEPVRVYERPDGRRVIIDGNHRASIALALGRDLPAVLAPAPVALRSIVANAHELYGSTNKKGPYQSISHRGEVLVKGRRPDMARRMAMLHADDLAGASVLDLGCNVGGNCYLAVEAGAASAHGLELSPRIATAAIRLNNYFTAPCRFTPHNLDQPFRPAVKYDVVLCFSVDAHLPGPEAIVETIRASTGRVLYLEGHPSTSRADYAYVLDAGLFSSVDLLGYGVSSDSESTLSRPLWRCQV